MFVSDGPARSMGVDARRFIVCENDCADTFLESLGSPMRRVKEPVIGSRTGKGERMIGRLLQLSCGFLLAGLAIAMMLRAAVGLSPWDVLAQGIAIRAGVPFGLASVVVGCSVMLLWIPLRQRFGVGTILNALLIGPSTELFLLVVPPQDGLWIRVSMFAGGLVLISFATGLYIGARFGPGPRDGLMTGLNGRLGWPIWVARSVVELTALSLGWVLGGNVGWGTIAFTVLIGPLVHLVMRYLPSRVEH
ncbi:MAG TPA: hypothetical protein VIQ78_05610 [Terrimesophilobacter sp.]